MSAFVSLKAIQHRNRIYNGKCKAMSETKRGMMYMPEYKKTIFIRFIMSYTILSVVLIGIMGGYWYTQTNGIMEDEIVKDNQNRLNSAKDYIEQTVLKKYEDNLQNKALSIRFIQENFNLNLLLNKSWEGNLSRIASFRQDLDFTGSKMKGSAMSPFISRPIIMWWIPVNFI